VPADAVGIFTRDNVHTPYQFFRGTNGRLYYEADHGLHRPATHEMLCAEGATTGHKVCGNVQKVRERIKVTDGPYRGEYIANIFKVTLHGHCDFRPGDSGAYASTPPRRGGVYVAGILSKGDNGPGECSSSGFDHGYFSDARASLSALGLTLLTK